MEEALRGSPISPGLGHLENQDPCVFLEELPLCSGAVGVPDRPGVSGDKGGRPGDKRPLTLRGGARCRHRDRDDDRHGGEDVGRGNLFRLHARSLHTMGPEATSRESPPDRPELARESDPRAPAGGIRLEPAQAARSLAPNRLIMRGGEADSAPAPAGEIALDELRD
jgi:hypothetical protein